MIELLIIHLFLQIFRTNLSANATPWNTSVDTNGNLTAFPSILVVNIPWFFPFITLVLMLATDYIFGIKQGVDSKKNFFAVALSYTFIGYILVLGKLSNSGYFYMFEIIMVTALYIMTIFSSQEP
jgi:hypothetical protein